MVFQNFPPVQINKKVIDRVRSTKFLSMVIDDNLNWKDHISFVCLCLSKSCGILHRVRDKLTLEAMFSFCYSLRYSEITWCISVLGSTWPSYLDKILKPHTNKTILRVMSYKRNFVSSEEVFLTLNLLKVTIANQYFMLDSLFNFLKNTHNVFMV